MHFGGVYRVLLSILTTFKGFNKHHSDAPIDAPIDAPLLKSAVFCLSKQLPKFTKIVHFNSSN